MKTHAFARQSSTFARYRADIARARILAARRARTRLVIFLKHSLRLLKFGRRERQSRIFVLAHLFQTLRVLTHLFQQVLLLLIVRIRALFKLLEPRSILLKRFSRYDGVVSLETHASRRSTAVARAVERRDERQKQKAIPPRASSFARVVSLIPSRRASLRNPRASLESSNARHRARTSAAACPPVHPVIARARTLGLFFSMRVDSRSSRARRRVARSASRCAAARALLE